MKKFTVLPLGISLLLITTATWSALGTTNIQTPTTSDDPITTQTITKAYHFSTPTIKQTNDYITIHLQETNAFLTISGNPILPYHTQTFEFPFGTQIKDITYNISSIKEIQLPKIITPAPKPVSHPSKTPSTQEINTELYNSNHPYPTTWYSYRLGGGLNRNHIHTTFLTLQINPVRYLPQTNTIQYIDDITIHITLETPIKPFTTADEYDLLIITYTPYAPLLKRLVTHKNSHNIQTKLVTLNEIQDGTYFSPEGRDIQEHIKYFIKNAIEQWGITYVLLVGNYKKIPVRYTHLETAKGQLYEELEFISDLYYSDIYDSDGNFSSWDTDDDGIYGEWPDSFQKEDIVDLYPDVYIGRLACMFRFEVKANVDKIITYEENAYDSEWFNTIIVGGGDTFDKSWEGGTDYNEGEEANQQALNFMDGFTPIKIWASLGNLKTATLIEEIEQGAGFLYLVGHGNPRNWATHENGDYENWTEGILNRDIIKLSNKGMYPILMVGGCHNSQFDVTPLNLLKNLTHAWIFSTWVPECWSWVFLANPRGGTIGSMGSTGYGGVTIGDHNGNDIPDCVEGADGWFETQFFRIYNQEHIDMLGATYAQTISDYVDNFPVDTDRYDSKIVQTHVLFGDPSLKIGGYA
jgi:hypothetical protein